MTSSCPSRIIRASTSWSELPGTLDLGMVEEGSTEVTPDPETVTELLEGIPGAYERILEAEAQFERGEFIALDELVEQARDRRA